MNTISKEVRDHPVSQYLNNLQSMASKKTMALALRRALSSKENPISNITMNDVYEFPWPTVNQAQVKELKAALLNRSSAATASQTITAVKGVLGAVFDSGMISGDELKRIERIPNPKVKQDPTTGRYIEPEEIEKLKEVLKADNTPAGKRDLAILGWMWSQGTRSGEVCGAAFKDYEPKTGKLIIKNGKGGITRENQLKNGAHAAMNDWIQERGNWPGPLFVKTDKYGNIIKSKNHLCTHTINNMLAKRQRQAGIERFSPHDLRRTTATELIKLHGIRNAQIILGHTEISTTARYDRGSKDKAFELAGSRIF